MNPEQNTPSPMLPPTESSKKSLIIGSIVALILIAGGTYAFFASKNSALENLNVIGGDSTPIGSTTPVESNPVKANPGTYSTSTSPISSAEKEQVIQTILARTAIFLSGDIPKIKKLYADNGTQVDDAYIKEMLPVITNTLKLLTSEVLHSSKTTWTISGTILTVEVRPDAGDPIPMYFEKKGGVWR